MGTVQLSLNFCSKMIKDSMNFMSFQKNDFMKIALLYSKFLWQCDLNGKYYPEKFVPHNIRFFRETDVINQINNCRSNLATDKAAEMCQDCCSNYNPVKYSRDFEGGLSKLYAFYKGIEKQMDDNQKSYDDEQKKYGRANLTSGGRLLEEGLKIERQKFLTG